MRARTLPTLVLSLVSVASSFGLAADPPKSELLRSTPIEQLPDDKAAAKIVFIAGSNFFKPGEHAYTEGCAVLMHLAGQTKGVAPVLAIDWPKKPETLAGTKAVVLFFDGAEKHHVLKENHLDEFQKLIDAGVGVTALHQGPDLPAAFHDRGRQWFGGVWEKGYSQRAHWVHRFETFPDHAIARGVTPFQIDDGWLFRLRFVPEMTGITPLLRTVSPTKPVKLSDGSEDIVGWAYERPSGGRSFTFTGGHLHKSLAEEGYRRLLTNGILWSAGIEIPTSGAPVELNAKALEPAVATTAAN
jgi:hypothetical protein